MKDDRTDEDGKKKDNEGRKTEGQTWKILKMAIFKDFVNMGRKYFTILLYL